MRHCPKGYRKWEGFVNIVDVRTKVLKDACGSVERLFGTKLWRLGSLMGWSMYAYKVTEFECLNGKLLTQGIRACRKLLKNYLPILCKSINDSGNTINEYSLYDGTSDSLQVPLQVRKDGGRWWLPYG